MKLKMEEKTDIWQSVSMLSESKLEKAKISLTNLVEKTQDPDKKARINRIISVAEYLYQRSGHILERQDYKELMESLGIKNRKTMRNYLQEINSRAY